MSEPEDPRGDRPTPPANERTRSRGRMKGVAVKGKWAQGIRPRNFHWIIKDQLAICERPGGYGANHRRVRRQEEIIWIREQEFTNVISLIGAPHNLHNYDELNVAHRHWPFQIDEPAPYLATVFPELRGLLQSGAKLLLHGEELGDRICGMMAGYVLWAGLIDTGPRAIQVAEQITSRQLGPIGRELVTMSADLPR
jgi:hypothetical protein